MKITVICMNVHAIHLSLKLVNYKTHVWSKRTDKIQLQFIQLPLVLLYLLSLGYSTFSSCTLHCLTITSLSMGFNYEQ